MFLLKTFLIIINQKICHNDSLDNYPIDSIENMVINSNLDNDTSIK